jgi:hypothetical protein
MEKKGIHRVTPNSESGRRMISVGKVFDPSRIPPDIAAHNKAVDDKRKAKLAAKLAKDGHTLDPNKWAFDNGLTST